LLPQKQTIHPNFPPTAAVATLAFSPRPQKWRRRWQWANFVLDNEWLCHSGATMQLRPCYYLTCTAQPIRLHSSTYTLNLMSTREILTPDKLDYSKDQDSGNSLMQGSVVTEPWLTTTFIRCSIISFLSTIRC
jgi:hypothetical protein